MSKELRSRILISAIGIPAFIWVFLTGGMVLWIALGLLSAIGMWEYRKMLFKDKPIWLYIDIFLSICVFLTTGVDKEKTCPSCLIPSWATIAYYFILQTVFWFARQSVDYKFKDLLMTLWGLFYLAVIPGLILRIDINYHSEHLLLLLIIMIWITDSAAYFIGMRYGKHRGIFSMSPMKSSEGFISGLIAPFIFSILIFSLIKTWTIPQLLFISVCAGFFGQIGDLLESKIKRMANVKDSSNIIPGHGGILDRFDSLLIAGPVLYVILIFLR